MLKLVKRQIKALLHTLLTAEDEIQAVIEREDAAGLINVLADAQDAAVAIGNKVEEAEGAGKAAAAECIAMLEKYCEYLWLTTQEQDMQAQRRLCGDAWRLLAEAGQMLDRIPEETAVVFMPYKASMWDCMESVWQAACEDPECIPFVVPIPYFDLKDGEVAARHYEGDQFPDYVPVMDYNIFPLEELHPDIIFVHNPFDDYNVVTSVLPQYYSAELKKITEKLVYIPYYITGDGVFVTHRYLPAYENMDYIVTQCQQTIASFSAELPREKFLPYGSPIADRVLKLEKEKPPIPEAWKPQLKNGRDFGSDRVVMLNTSISLLMKQKERFLDKVEYLIDLAKQKKGITLVWRPHPLLFASARSMGEEFAARLSRLEEKFLAEKIGVLDKNPDVGVTVALCDAYLGETASSVIHMFGIAGKPRFYINMQIPEGGRSSVEGYHGGQADEEILASAWCAAGEKEYYVLDESAWIVEKDIRSGHFRLVVKIPGREVVWGRAYRGMERKGERLWVYPENAEGTFIYDMATGKMRRVFEADAGKQAQAQREDSFLIKIDDRCLSMIRAEKFRRDNKSHVWHENEENTLDAFFRFLQTADDNELIGVQGVYSVWLENLDGSCGRKVLQAVKEGVSRLT